MARFHFTLRLKLGFALGVMAVAPLAVSYPVGLKVILDRLNTALRQRSGNTADIARNVLLRQVQQISQRADRIAADPELARLLTKDPRQVARHLRAAYGAGAGGLVEVFRRRKVVGRHGSAGLQLRTAPDNLAVRKALDYERHLTLERVADLLVIRTSSPIVDRTFTVQGAVVITTPLDARMAEFIKGVVRAEVGFLVGQQPSAATFVNASGARVPGRVPPPRVQHQVRLEDIVYLEQTIGGRVYGTSYAQLLTGDRKFVGMLVVGLSLQELRQATSSASGFLALGAVGGLVLATIFAYLLGSRITRPLGRFSRTTLAIAGGDLDQQVVVKTDDEIGDLARAIQTMTESLREHRAAQEQHQHHLEREVKRRTAELEQANAKLEQLARTDPLTNVFNRRVLRGALLKEVERSSRSRLPLSLLMLDVDNFKHYNDVNGHQAGDEVLRMMGRELSDGRRLNDVVARYGGEEFAILLADTPREAATVLASQIRDKIEQQVVANEEQQPGGKLTISVGVATCPDHAETPDELVAAADAALYQAKHDGRNCVRVAGAGDDSEAEEGGGTTEPTEPTESKKA